MRLLTFDGCALKLLLWFGSNDSEWFIARNLELLEKDDSHWLKHSRYVVLRRVKNGIGYVYISMFNIFYF